MITSNESSEITIITNNDMFVIGSSTVEAYLEINLDFDQANDVFGELKDWLKTQRKSRNAQQRSAAATRGWETRRKRQP